MGYLPDRFLIVTVSTAAVFMIVAAVAFVRNQWLTMVASTVATVAVMGWVLQYVGATPQSYWPAPLMVCAGILFLVRGRTEYQRRRK